MRKTITIIIVMAALAGAFLTGRKTASPVEILAQSDSYCDLSSWQALELAIIKTESEFNPTAIGTHQDIGILQITPIYVAEVNRILDTIRFEHSDAFSVEKSLQMFDIYQAAKNPQKDIERAIRLHNPNGDSIGYTGRVMNNYRQIVEMEEIRKQLITK